MKFLLLNIFLFCSFIVLSNYNETRELYQNAHKNKSQSEEFFNHINKKVQKNPDDAVYMTYYGAAKIIQSKFEEKPSTKIKLLKSGSKIIDREIKENPHQIELIFIRLSIQENLPDKINYDNIEEDKKEMIHLFKKSSASIKNYIGAYVERSNVFSTSEKKYFE